MVTGLVFKPREMMELAVEVMHKSVSEPRTDGKISPLVGAVIYKRDGTIETASRGELRYGDHAEFTLLERKNRHLSLDGAVLFATLEPCAPGARQHPKLGCAERIVLARIAKVYVGIEDPDPAVARKGIEYLRNNGIEVVMFDEDLQKQITVANEDFLDQANFRASQQDTDPIVPKFLSSLEGPENSLTFSSLSPELLESYRKVLKPAVDAGDDYMDRLVNQGVLYRDKTILRPSGFGLILFGKAPTDKYPRISIQLSFTSDGGAEERASIEEPILIAPGKVFDWLSARLPALIDRTTGMERSDPDAAFKKLLREAITNAIVHRDYDVAAAKIQILATKDKVVFKSPGKPVEPLSMEQLQSFTAPTLSRNPLIHRVFSRMSLAEEQGYGMKTFREAIGDSGLASPAFTWEEPYTVLTVFRTIAAAIDSDRFRSLPREDQEVVLQLSRLGTFSSAEYATVADVPPRTAQNHLKKLTESGVLRKIGTGKATRYEVQKT